MVRRVVRYEQRIFHHLPVEGMPQHGVMRNLEGILDSLGGINCLSTTSGLVMAKTYYVAPISRNQSSYVMVEADCLGSSRVLVVNEVGPGHPELLHALHKSFDGKPGYNGMPERTVVERGVIIDGNDY